MCTIKNVYIIQGVMNRARSIKPCIYITICALIFNNNKYWKQIKLYDIKLFDIFSHF